MGYNRAGQVSGFDDPSSGAITMDNTQYGTSQSSKVYAGITDARGVATVEIKQPRRRAKNGAERNAGKFLPAEYR